MLELYHGTTSVCAQKARLTLAEKGLEWESHLMPLNGDQLDLPILREIVDPRVDVSDNLAAEARTVA